MKKKSSRKTWLMMVFVVIMGATIVTGLGGISRMPVSEPPTGPAEENNASGTHDVSSSNPASAANTVFCESFLQPPPQQYRIHLRLTLVINGKNVAIPAGIGITEDCRLIIHTSDAQGTIEIEPYTATAFTLGDFFSVWGRNFPRTGYWIIIATKIIEFS